ncbi:unknown protein [Seminavis robusta]|uniref:SnoaL-like domain-containing protein n=1 Tax=Seminavis robusta TaxID=568900 RepID=A0A9N8HYG8_9STRA|nr:expressed unknown protein [Seminavis robusta]CAB9529405.1 unknown protein [Seminavis robusta]|eukprot:Sro1309_g261560.1 n/a (193) ;mRNA; r:28726-29304
MNPLRNIFRGSSKKAQPVKGCENKPSTDVVPERNVSPKEVKKSWKIELVEAFIQKWSEHDMGGAHAMVTDDFVIVFASADNMELEYQDYVAETTKVFEAFPDFNFRYESLTEGRDGVVLWKNVVPNGHHTAKPYAFGPCDPIEPTGKYVENSPETGTFYFKDGKIAKMMVVAHGEMTGPAGIYTQLGGFPLM